MRAAASRSPLALRRRWRLATRRAIGVWDGRVALPRRLGATLAGGLMVVTGLYGTAISGEFGRRIDGAFANAGYAIADLRLDGARETSEIDIARGLGIGSAQSLLGIDVADARRRLLALPWVDGARVAKEFPRTVAVEIDEREPVALWRVGERTLILDARGAPIVESDGRPLPLLVGEGADIAMDDGLDLFSAVGEVTPHVKAMVRVANRRWNLVTRRNVVVMLPEREPRAALRVLAGLHRDRSLLEREVAAIDLRLPDRIAVRLTDEGAATHAVRLEEKRTLREDTRDEREVSL